MLKSSNLLASSLCKL